jgi:hypothetical protein
MKTSAKYVSLVVATGAAGATLFTLAGASFTAAFRGDVIIAVVASVAVAGFAAYDYSRRTPPLKAPARILRPSRIVSATAQKTKAYGVKPVREERLAA